MFGQLLSAGLGFLGQQQANADNRDANHTAHQVNIQEAAKNREFQQASADKEMAFQERMSNTSYQRGAADLKAAGLNPMLAATGGQSSSPSGAMASGSQASSGPGHAMENSLAAFKSTALDIEQIKNMRSQNSLTESQNKKTKMEIAAIGVGLPGKEAEGHAWKAGQKILEEIFNRNESGAKFRNTPVQKNPNRPTRDYHKIELRKY